MRKAPSWISNAGMNRFLTNRFPAAAGEERESLKEYFKEIFLRPGSTEYALYVCFNLGMRAKVALESEKRLGRTNLPITFIYGDKDWNRFEEVEGFVARQTELGKDCKLIKIEGSDHHMYYDQPGLFVDLFCKDVFEGNETKPDIVETSSIQEA